MRNIQQRSVHNWVFERSMTIISKSSSVSGSPLLATCQSHRTPQRSALGCLNPTVSCNLKGHQCVFEFVVIQRTFLNHLKLLRSKIMCLLYFYVFSSKITFAGCTLLSARTGTLSVWWKKIPTLKYTKNMTMPKYTRACGAEMRSVFLSSTKIMEATSDAFV